MIFSNGVDLSLWYIMKADKKNRGIILKFIEEIPQEFLIKIRKSLKLREENVKNGNEEFECSDSIVIDNICYSYQIDDDNSITLTKGVLNGNYYDDEIELIIFSQNSKELKNLPNFCDEWLGTLTTNIKTHHYSEHFSEEECQESEYNYYNTPLGVIIGYNREFYNKDIPFIKYVNSKKIPEDINLNNLPKRRVLKK